MDPQDPFYADLERLRLTERQVTRTPSHQSRRPPRHQAGERFQGPGALGLAVGGSTATGEGVAHRTGTLAKSRYDQIGNRAALTDWPGQRSWCVARLRPPRPQRA